MAGHKFDTVEDLVTGRPVVGATIQVYEAGATLSADHTTVTSGTYATIYSDDGITLIDQAGGERVTTRTNGFFEFWTNENSVVIQISYGGGPKWAIDDVEITGGEVNSDLSALGVRVDNHDALLGTATNAQDLGTFTGSTISDNSSVLNALQELETAVEAGAPTGDVTASGLTMSSARVLGRTGAGTGAIQELTAAQVRSFVLNEVPVFNFSDDGEARFYADVAMTLTHQSTSGTGTIAYEKSTAAAPGTFSSATSPITLEAGAWLKVSASSVTGLVAAALKRTA
ncbi:hypothetical protein [Qipengyuania oceanensis]|uniref:Uncharacterized protein n=1 Tax=Qipengyuania oceanensis TaxID=1463597 RepID=A0A844YK56_9SPHN|nr:hypothetical protein [Qipengyuania oceanensis]MXO63418.1 hypothetical protein [Qipengyuania oceanensis]